MTDKQVSKEARKYYDELINKLANYYEDIFGHKTALFDSEKKELNLLQAKEEVELPIFYFVTAEGRISEDEKTYGIVINALFGSDVEEKVAKEIIIEHTPIKFAGVKIDKIAYSSIHKIEADGLPKEVSVYQYPVIFTKRG